MNRKILMITSLVSVLALAGCQTSTLTNVSSANINAANTSNDKQNSSVNNSASNTNTNKATTIISESFPNKTGPAQWLTTPEKLDDLKLFKNNRYIVSYNKIADLPDGGSMIYAVIINLGTPAVRFIKNSDGEYYVLKNYSSESIVSRFSDYFYATVHLDDTTTYQGLTGPDTLLVNDLNLQKVSLAGPIDFFDFSLRDESNTLAHPKIGTVTKFASTDFGDVYLYEHPQAIIIDTTIIYGSIKTKKYMLKLADTSVLYYNDVEDFLALDGSLLGTFNNTGASFKSRQFLNGVIMGGWCLKDANQFVTNINSNDLTIIGQTPSGKNLYTITDSTNYLLKIAYNTYKEGRNSSDFNTSLLSYDEFVAKQPVLLWKDGKGDYLLFLDRDFELFYCGPYEPSF